LGERECAASQGLKCCGVSLANGSEGAELGIGPNNLGKFLLLNDPEFFLGASGPAQKKGCSHLLFWGGFYDLFFSNYFF
jgi:hypothetical protein